MHLDGKEKEEDMLIVQNHRLIKNVWKFQI